MYRRLCGTRLPPFRCINLANGLQVPTEVLSHVASFLRQEDRFKFRLVCKPCRDARPALSSADHVHLLYSPEWQQLATEARRRCPSAKVTLQVAVV